MLCVRAFVPPIDQTICSGFWFQSVYSVCAPCVRIEGVARRTRTTVIAAQSGAYYYTHTPAPRSHYNMLRDHFNPVRGDDRRATEW